MPSVVLIVRCPLCGRAAEAGGHSPLPPAWMCIACTSAASSSNPAVVTVNVATFPLRRTVAFPEPVTWLVGTSPSADEDSWPAFLLEDDVDSTTTAATA